MATPSRFVRYCLASCALGSAALAGCAMPHGSTGGDPVLGNFNRPISPTPMPYSGQGGYGSPAYDGGARLGQASPDVPMPNPYDGGPSAKTSWNMPAPNVPPNVDLAGGTRKEAKPHWSYRLFNTTYTKPPTDGAKMMGTEEQIQHAPLKPSYDAFPAGSQSAARPIGAVTNLLNGSSIPMEVQSTSLKMVPESRDAGKVSSLEEGQLVLTSFGMRWQELKQADNGDWLYSCVVAADPAGTSFRRFDARHPSALEAVRAVVDEAKKSK